MPHKIRFRRADDSKDITWTCDPGELFTGFVDSCGNELWEGDKVKWLDPLGPAKVGKIFYNESSASFGIQVFQGKNNDIPVMVEMYQKMIGYVFKIKEGEI